MRRMASLPQIAGYWSERFAEHLPLLADVHDITRAPFCFHCGWRSPLPADLRGKSPWFFAKGWLERAHLHDHFSGGPDTPDNLVPLCALCHRGMPEYPKAEDRIVGLRWVASEIHDSVPRWWQKKTDHLWSGDDFKPYVGSVDFFNIYVSLARRRDQVDRSWLRAERGDRDGAIALMRSGAAIPEAEAAAAIDAYIRTFRDELVAA